MPDEVLKRALYLIYPKRCALCGEVIEPKRELCPECENTKQIGDDACKKCGRDKARCVCKKFKFSIKYKAVTAPFYYKGSIARGVQRFKNYGYRRLDKGMGEYIAQRVKRIYPEVKYDTVTSVPMTKRDKRDRGYNQAELLAVKTAEFLDISYSPLLRKIRETPNQRFSSIDERQVNLFGAFDLIEGAEVEEKTILIIDDIKTTGSTLSECAAMLKAYGAKEVYAAVLAIGSGDNN